MIIADTHTILWLTGDRASLSLNATAILQQYRTRDGIGISGISLWEIAILVKKDRITLLTPLTVYLQHLESLFTVLPVTGRIAEHAARFGSNYPKDPADRLIGATAVVHDTVLVTKDKPIRNSGEVNCIW